MNWKVRLSHSNVSEVTSLLGCDIVQLIEECLVYQNTISFILGVKQSKKNTN